jgi:branched-chain amino acid transport system substrate-binding protein
LPPIIEFDALFLPDSHDRIALIAPALTVEDVIVERDPEALARIERSLRRKVQPITLLGTGAWDSPELPKQAGRSVEHAIFPVAWFPGAKDPASQELRAAYKRHFGRRPSLPDALLWDATRLVREALRREPPTTTADLRDAIAGIEGFQGATGALSFAGGNGVQRALMLLTIADGAIRPLGP